MFSTLISLSVAWNVLIFPHEIDASPLFTEEPPNPSRVVEGENITLRWIYDVGDTLRDSNVVFVPTGGTVALKDSTGVFVVSPYSGRAQVVISDNETALTLLGMNRSDDGDYRYQIRNNAFRSKESVIKVFVQFKPENVQLSTNATGNQACLRSYLNFTCSVGTPGNPQVYYYQLFRNDTVVGTSSSGEWIRMLSSSGVFTYKCQANNTVGAANSTTVTVTVGEASTIQPLLNKTTTEGEKLNLSCDSSGTPPPVVSWVRISTGQRFDGHVLALTNINRNEAGDYRCEASNDCGNDSKTTTIHVKFKPTVTFKRCPTPVTEGDNATLYCNATGYPVPSFAWINASSGNIESSTKTLVITAITRGERGSYTCHASNEIGNGTQTCEIDVYYPPKIIIPSNNTIEVEYQFDVKCEADGNPMPTYVWRNTTGGVIAEKSSFKATEDGNYTCFATNSIKTVNRSISITVKYDDFFLAMTIEELEYIPDYGDPNSQAAQDLREKVVIEINKLHEHVRYFNRTEVTGFSEGSVVVSFVVYFNTPVTTVGGLATLQNAVDSGKLGQFKVRRGSLNILDRENRVTTTPIVSTTESTAVTSTISNKKGDLTDGPPWPIIGGAIGAVVVVIIIILIVACWVHKKRKCRKDTKIHNSESEVLQGQNDIEDGVHAKVNGGYADAGPPSANGTNRFVQPQPEQQQQQAAAAPPDYAVVDKSKKKNKDSNKGNENIPDYAVVDKSKKKKNKKAEAQDPYAEVEDRKKDKDKKKADPGTHDYAVVNKSKKKKKEEDENAYAVVDKSKKSKKKPKAPGEVLYADLDDFKPVQAPSMPTVSTSPEPLAPLKRPTSYQATEYADITQFLKGNATLPEGQSTEMEPTYANAGGGQEAANKENAKTGGEGGGGDTEHKETPM